MKTTYIFGDSIAAGQGCSQSWPELLSKSVKDSKIIVNAVGGDTTFETLQRFDVKNPDLIIFAIGLNDSSDFDGEKRVSIEQFKKNIEKLIKLSGKTKTIFVGLTPADEKRSITPFEAYTNKEIKKYDDALKRICKKHNITFVEIFDRWMKIDYKKLLGDGLHPNDKGHELLFKEITSSD